MIEVELSKLIIDEKRHDQLIVLKEKHGRRLLPIVIGLAEISAIKMKISNLTPPRPLTHDLFKDTIEKLRASVEKIVIDRVEESTFYAKIYLKDSSGAELVLDARPSDSIALAVRAHTPIFVEEEVLNKADTLPKENT
ncbi:MAG: bifunctional nuclease family protein [Candidatus Omnitrophota bacterium]|jgi:bifunctional DNase/RNase|nr:bifunctional nuclease family protein [Candidatus Omnitrophota bacterium]MDD5527269.1 bifunctional nuclease family protein [Candidatus Omnitrophota bacterium]